MKRIRLQVLVVAVLLLLAACGDDAEQTTTEAPADTQTTAATAATETTAASETTTATEGPSELGIAVFFVGPADDTWSTSILAALARLEQTRPHDLDIAIEWFETVDYADAERVVRDLAASDKYGIIIGHSIYSDAINAVKGDYPDIAFAFTGSGNEPEGGNGYWLDVIHHEPAYLAGIAAGMMSETNKVGSVGAFPFPNVAGPINAFFDGAKSVNPDIGTGVTYIESWFDPLKALDAGTALINSGADSVYAASAFGVFQAASDADRAFAIGDLDDQQGLAPDVVITSVMALWDPSLTVVIDAWWDYHTQGMPYDAPLERIQFSMAEGGADIAPLNEAIVPADVIAAVTDAREQILSGELVVEFRAE